MEQDVFSPTAGAFWEPCRVMIRWRKGSIYRLMWQAVGIFYILYIILTVFYKYGLSQDAERNFETVAGYVSSFPGIDLPVAMLLTFLFTACVERGLALYHSLPGVAQVIAFFDLALQTSIPNGKELVDLYSRWVLLAWALTFRLISKPFRDQWADLSTFEKRGFLLSHERERLQKYAEHEQPLLVLDWMILICRTYRESMFCNDDFGRNLGAILTFKRSCTITLKYCWKNIPFSLLQTVYISVFVFGFASLMTRQFLVTNPVGVAISDYVPILVSLPFLIYLAWVMLGHISADPFGEDDEDINVQLLFRKHIETARRLAASYRNGSVLVNRSVKKMSRRSIDVIRRHVDPTVVIDIDVNGAA